VRRAVPLVPDGPDVVTSSVRLTHSPSVSKRWGPFVAIGDVEVMRRPQRTSTPRQGRSRTTPSQSPQIVARQEVSDERTADPGGVTRPSLAQLTDVEATATAPTDTPLLWRKGVDGQWRPEPAPPFAEDAPAILGELAAHEVRLDGHDEDLDAKANIASPTFTGTVGGVTKAMVGLGSVANLAPADLPVSTATAAAIASAPGAVASVNGATGAVVLTKADVGLGNVTNTSDTAKPVSTAQQAALDAKAPLASPTFTRHRFRRHQGPCRARQRRGHRPRRPTGQFGATGGAEYPPGRGPAHAASVPTDFHGRRCRRRSNPAMAGLSTSAHGPPTRRTTSSAPSPSASPPQHGTGQTYRRLNQPAQDLTNRKLAMLVKVDQPTNLFQIQMYSALPPCPTSFP
jgi:hypothetical protein